MKIEGPSENDEPLNFMDGDLAMHFMQCLKKYQQNRKYQVSDGFLIGFLVGQFGQVAFKEKFNCNKKKESLVKRLIYKLIRNLFEHLDKFGLDNQINQKV